MIYLEGALIRSKSKNYNTLAWALKGLSLTDVNKKFIGQHLGLPVRQLIRKQDLSKDFIDRLILEFRKF